MNKIGSKIIFVGFPKQIPDNEYYRAMSNKLKEVDLYIPENNPCWQEWLNKIRKYYPNCCDFIDYHEFSGNNVIYFRESKLIIFYSKLFDNSNVQENQIFSEMELHKEWLENNSYIKSFVNNNLSYEDAFLEFLKDNKWIKRASIKDDVYNRIDDILRLKPFCRFCFIPMSKIEGDFKLSSSYNIVEALRPRNKITIPDFTYFDILETKYPRSLYVGNWRKNLRLTEDFFNISESKSLMSHPENVEIFILLCSSPHEFYKNFCIIMTGMGYETNLILNKYKRKTENMGNPTNGSTSILKFPIIGNSLELVDLYNTLSLIQINFAEIKKGSHVLITGDTGVGKEGVAQLVGNFYEREIPENSVLKFEGSADGITSKRIMRDKWLKGTKDAPRFGIGNCAGIQDDHAISQIFGHIKGSFTGAYTDRVGLVHERAAVVFLDEAQELGARAAALLLRFLQEGEYTVLGESKTRKSECIIICATNRKEYIPELLKIGLIQRFKYIINVPTLNSRIEDIKDLAKHFYNEYVKELSGYYPRWSIIKGFIGEWENRDWTDNNIRELKKEVIKSIDINIRNNALRIVTPRRNHKITKAGTPGNPVKIIEFTIRLILWYTHHQTGDRRESFLRFWAEGDFGKMKCGESAIRSQFQRLRKDLEKMNELVDELKEMNLDIGLELGREDPQEAVKDVAKIIQKIIREAEGEDPDGFHEELTNI